jgi:hypothetical protein
MNSQSPLPRRLIRTIVLVWIFGECLTAFVPLYHNSWRPMGPAVLERGPVRFLLQNDLTGRLFHDSEIASYLQWRLDGNPPLYLDNIDAFPPQVVENFWQIARATERGRQLLDDEQIEIVVLSADRGTNAFSLAPLANHLDANPAWGRVHVSRGGMVWVRHNEKYRAIWEPREKIVSQVSFGTLEHNQRDRDRDSPPLIDDLDRENGRQPPPKWELFPRPAR